MTVVLQDSLTKGERSLVNDDLDKLVLSMRKAFQGTMRHDLIAGIEEILDRKVTVAVEVFLLAPVDAGPRMTAHAARRKSLARRSSTTTPDRPPAAT